MLTTRDRTRLRKLQDRWLARKARLYAAVGDDRPIFEGGPTIRQIRECVIPAWEEWFEGDLRDGD